MILNERTICRILTKEEDAGGEKCLEKEEEEEEEEEEIDETWKSNIGKLHEKYQRPFLDGCVYRGEGNANLVIALPCDRKVVRFRKSSRKNEASADGGRARIIREIEFLKYVISGFLGNYVQPPEPLRVNLEDMIKVSEAIRPLRPEYRRSKEIAEDYATLFTDYAFLPLEMTLSLPNNSPKSTFCVEIKPKQGFRHEFDGEFKKCTYCITQYYKLKTGAIKTRSNYCPYDLFSCDIKRMKKSLRGLIESPQNNFKIFKDGAVVYDSNTKRPNTDMEEIFNDWFSNCGSKTNEENFEIFFKLIIDSLLREFSSRDQNFHKIKRKKNIFQSDYKDFYEKQRVDEDLVSRSKEILNSSTEECNFSTNDSIPQDSVLGRILNMQKLPYLSRDLVYNVYSKHFTTLNDDSVYSQMIRSYRREIKASVNNVITKKDMDKDLTEISSGTINDKIPDKNGNESNGTAEDLRNNNGENQQENNISTITIEELEILQNYLLVTTARDCSILMAFQEIDPTHVENISGEFVIQITEGVNFMVNIGVLDLDPKSIHCIEKHRKRDTNVLLSLADVLQT